MTIVEEKATKQDKPEKKRMASDGWEKSWVWVEDWKSVVATMRGVDVKGN